MEDNEKIEENLNVLEKKMHAKKTILREVLRTIETEKDKSGREKNRKYIRDMLSCELSITSTENTCCTLEMIESFRFREHVVAKIRVANWLTENELTLRISSLGFSVRWILFDGDLSMSPRRSVSKNSSEQLLIALPFSAFFQNSQVSVTVYSREVPEGNQIFNPEFCTVIGANQTPEAPKEAVHTLRIDSEKASEELELKCLEFCDEQKALRIFQSLLLVSAVFSIPETIKMAAFRREFPRFSCIDFDTWQLFVGTEHFENLFVYIPAEEEKTKSRVIAGKVEIGKMFLRVLEEKCSKSD